jgi:hypothetical protein
MLHKRIVCPDRLRRVPKHFSWVDHRLVRDKRICGISHHALALYLFLVTVCDAEGLSYYSDTAIERYLSLSTLVIAEARAELCTAGLIAYSRPLYQVLSLDTSSLCLPAAPCEHPPARGASELVSLGDLMRQAMGVQHD